MTADATVPSDVQAPEVVSSVDVGPRAAEFIIADIGCDDAWLSMRADDAPTLPEMR